MSYDEDDNLITDDGELNDGDEPLNLSDEPLLDIPEEDETYDPDNDYH